MPDLLRRARLYAHTLPHLRPWQVAGRVVAGLKRKFAWPPLPEPPRDVSGRLRPAAPFPHHDPWNRREDILGGRFTFLNQTEALGWPVDWTAPDAPLLWRFNLHYFHFLHLLRPEDQVRLCRDWIASNAPQRGVGWHPYPTSLRIVNWCKAGFTDANVQRSLYLQAAHLYRNLETYVHGNHLLENARALVFAGTYFEGQGEAPKWLDRGLEIYREETLVQILPDGGHFERSPMYHALMLEGYLDVLNLLPPAHPDKSWLSDTVSKMVDVLASLTHPDGNIALFNDATHEIAPSAETLLNYARVLTSHAPSLQAELPEMGYYTYRDDDLYLVIDAGPAGPDYLMAHAHADIFSFEFSIGGKPFVVDTGVYEYAAGRMRDYVRSTQAHNTVTVDGTDQIECWGSFRVGRRSAPEGGEFEQGENSTVFEGIFRGYQDVIGDGIVHCRRIEINPQMRRIKVEDRITGKGRHHVVSRLHLHPDVVVKEDESLVLESGAASCRLAAGDAAIHIERGKYCPRFGVMQDRSVCYVGGDVALPVTFSFELTY